jgi:Uma2 family endonuclease
MHTTVSPPEQRVVMDDVPWSVYLGLVENSDGRHTRIAYDQGVMEITSPSRVHETESHLIGRMVETFTEEAGLPLDSVASTTFKRDDLERGFEADESYYIGNAAAVRGLDEIDLLIHPAPDLVIEVDISRSSMKKFSIFASLKIPEVWRYDGECVHVYVLNESETYDAVEQSSVLPGFPVSDVPRWLAKWRTTDENELIGAFRREVRTQLADRTDG